MMTSTEQSVEDLRLTIEQETRVQAPLDVTFAALLEQLGPGNETPDGKPMSMAIEAWPAGRWWRDLGEGDGHCWGHVQAIKRPTLLEFSGPLFMSQPVTNNVQFRLSEEGGETVIRMRHAGFGLVPEQHRRGVQVGWAYMLERIRKRAEAR